MAECGKVRFTKFRAFAALERNRKHRNPRRMEKRVYFCPECNAYHLTKKNEIDQSDRERRINFKRKKIVGE